MLNQVKVSKKGIRKSQKLILGSFIVFLGIVILSSNYFKRIRNEIFSDMQIAISDSISNNTEEVLTDTPDANLITGEETGTGSSQLGMSESSVVDYSKYLGVLEIPKIGLKRGFYGIDSKYNDIQYNVTVVKGSTMPDVVNGNLILMAHSGDSYISYFAYLYRLEIGNSAYVSYNNNKYHYKIVNIYNVPKEGNVKIIRNFDKTTLTLITCTKDDPTSQTVYILELI